MSLNKNRIIIIGLVFLVILFFVLIFLGIIPGLRPSSSNNFYGGNQTKITLWGTDNQTAIQPLINSYSQINKNVQIIYSQFDEDNYEKNLIDALASGKGPDIFFFHNTWLPKHINKISPTPDAQLTLSQFRSLFPTVTEQNFVNNNKIYALPLYIDTLAFIYNKDIFDKKGIALPPSTWPDLQNLIPKITELDPSGRIIKSAVAIGGSEKSIGRASDLLSEIMLQFGADMFNQQKNQANFSDDKGLSALNFYLSFSDSNYKNYTWNDNLRYSLDNFASSQTASIFNYAASIPVIKSKNPYINLTVSPMPQLDPSNQINYANYWGLAVSAQSKNQNTAWDFIISTLTNSQISASYLKNSQLPPALRTLIIQYQTDPDLGVFANQALSARSWQQPDNSMISQIFSDMIESVLSGKLSSERALKQAENNVNNLW